MQLLNKLSKIIPSQKTADIIFHADVVGFCYHVKYSKKLAKIVKMEKYDLWY